MNNTILFSSLSIIVLIGAIGSESIEGRFGMSIGILIGVIFVVLMNFICSRL